MGSRGRKSGRGGASGKGPHHVTVTKTEIEKRITKEMKRVPSHLRRLLDKAGVKVHVVSYDQAKRIDPTITPTLRGFFEPGKKNRGVYVIADRFQHRRGAKNAAMTALHEQGHVIDQLQGRVKGLGKPLSHSPQFKAAMKADRNHQKSLKLTASEKKSVTYQHYPKNERPEELAAEGFAILHGSGRPANSPGHTKTSTFKKAWPNVLKTLKQQLQ